MAFASLVNGVDCGPANPLDLFKKAYNQDRTLQQDRFVPIAGPSQPFRSVEQYAVLDDEARQFYDASKYNPAFDLAPLGRALTPSQRSSTPAWAADFNVSQSKSSTPTWATDFQKELPTSPLAVANQAPQRQAYPGLSPQRYVAPSIYQASHQPLFSEWSPLELQRQQNLSQGMQENAQNAQLDNAFKQATEGRSWIVNADALD